MAARRSSSPSRKTYVGCDLGGTSIKVVRSRGRRILAAHTVPTPAKAKPGEILAALATATEAFAERAEAVGVAVPGFLDTARARVLLLSNLPALNGVPLKARLERRLRRPVVLDTDTNAGCVAEAMGPAGTGVDRVLYLSLGTGLGAALTIDGRPVRTANHTVGHIANLRIAEDGPRRRGSPRGAAETLLGARGIVWQAHRHGLSAVDSPAALSTLAATRSSEGASARVVWREVGALIGKLSALLASLVAAERIIVGGGTAAASRWFLGSARRALRLDWPGALGAAPDIVPPQLELFSGALGAAYLARTQREGSR